MTSLTTLRQLIWAVLCLISWGSTSPIAKTLNGTYAGLHNSTTGIDYFLGLPYAQPPIANLRFRNPVPLNSSWNGLRTAYAIGDSCVGYGADMAGLSLSEDCLNVNIIRPAGNQSKLLPVAVWVYGGGYYEGAANRPIYNQTRFVQNAVKAGLSVIGVTFNYRLTAFGWLWSEETQALGDTNIGLRDQRLLLQWVQENIASFGGDPSKVTMYGESAGGISIGKHLMAYDGRDDGLFHNAILESGGPLEKWPYGYTNATDYMLKVYNNLTSSTNCSSSISPIECLRRLSFTEINSVLNVSDTWIPGTGLGPFIAMLDGDILSAPATSQISSGQFIKVPILYGTNFDEGTAIAPRGINSDTEFAVAIARGDTDNTTTDTLKILYPNIDAIGIPATYGPPPYTPSYGLQWKRAAAYWGDIVEHAPRRAVTNAWSRQNLTAYSYHFNVKPVGNADEIGVTHAAEVAWVFDYAEGGSFGDIKACEDVAELMMRMWVSFIYYDDPNWHGVNGTAHWPRYDISQGGIGKNFVFDGNRSSYVEQDDWRAAQIQYLIEKMPTQYYY